MKKRMLATFLALCLMLSLLPVTALGANDPDNDYEISNWDIEINGSNCCSEDDPHVITGEAGYQIAPAGIAHISVSGEHYIKAYNLKVEIPSRTVPALQIGSGSDVTLILEGENTLDGGTGNAGIYVASNAKLTIMGDGTLYASGGGGAAGIGGSNENTHCGDITIESGTIYAQGGTSADRGGAGIGSGYAVSGTCSGSITINGGYVNAKGGADAAGIGGGENVGGCDVVINGGVVYAEGDDSPSIGGGRLAIGDSNNGTFSTGTDGNAVIVAPQGLGSYADARNWDGIFVSYSGQENTATINNGTVVLDDSSANMQVWGDPVLDYDLTIENGTLKIQRDSEGVNESVSLTMDKNSTLTNNGTILLGSTGYGDDPSYLILEGGTGDTKGNGTLNVTEPAAVKLPLTKDLVTLDPESGAKYNGQAQKPTVTVELKNLWGYDQEFTVGQDYTQDSPQGEIKNAGTYTYTLKSTGTGNLLGKDEVEVTYTIDPADLTVTMPASWTVWDKETDPISKLPQKPNSISSQDAPGAISEVKNGTLSWYSDQSCTDPLEKSDLASDTTVYWKYTHNSNNFEDDITGSMSITLSNAEPADASITGGDKDKVYGDPAFDLNVSLTRGGNDVPIQSEVTWDSSNKNVAVVDENGQVTITGAGETTITAAVEGYTDQSNNDNSYPAVTGTFVLNVSPKPLTVVDTGLTLNGQPAGSDGAYTWSYDGKTTVTVDGVQVQDKANNTNQSAMVGSDKYDTDVKLEASGTLPDANAGTDKTVTIRYSLTGDRAKHYTLSPESGSEKANIEKADPDASGVIPKDGTLTITNNLAKTYFFNLSELLPENSSLGTVSYAAGAFTADATNNVYDGKIEPSVTAGNILVVKVGKVETTTTDKIGEIEVTITSQNYQYMTATITLKAENLDNGHSTGDITVRNVLAGNYTNPSDVFVYTIELKSEEINSGDETPITTPVAYRGTGEVTDGNDGTVIPNNGTITFTLKNDQYLIFSGNLDQAHKVNYTISQNDNGKGYITTATKAGDYNNGVAADVTAPVTGYLHCEHSDPLQTPVINEWAEIVFTNTKNAGTSSLVYDANGGNADSVPTGLTDVAAGTYTLSDIVPTHDQENGVDVLFMGWLENDNRQAIYEENGNVPTLITQVKLEDNTTTTVYAAWGYDRNGNHIPDALEVTLSYDANGGSGTAPATVCRKGASVTVSGNSWFSRSGYTFAGWNTRANGSGTGYAAGSTIALDSDTTLYAQWSYTGGTGGGTGSGGTEHDDDYTLYYHSNFGSDKRFYQSDDDSRMEVRDYEDMSFLPEREGYRFVGWNTKEDGSGKDYAPGDTFRLTGSTDHLYAQWERDERVPGVADPEETGVSRWLETEDHGAYLSGYPDGTFGPDRSMTRAEVAQMFYGLLLDKDVPVTVSFADVDDGAWYAQAVNALASLGMLSGYPDGTFRPDAAITRAEFATVAMGFAYGTDGASCHFTDVARGDWFYPYVAQAAGYGWIGGYPDGTFRPGNTITRAEVTTIVNNMLARAADEDYVDRNGSRLRAFADLTEGHWAFYQIMEATNRHDYRTSGGTERWRG